MSFTLSSIFPILGYQENADTYYAVGTAFFINNAGNFVTAAHTFNNKELKFFAIINDQAWPITQLFSEYVEMWDQKAPIHQDLYIGQVDTGSIRAYLSLKLSGTLAANDELAFNGFASKQYHDHPKPVVEVPVVETPKPPVHIDELFDLFDGDEETEDEDKQWPDVAASLARLKTSAITGKFIKQTFEGLHAMFNIKGAMTNGFTFALTNSEIEPKGLSGCPAIHEDNVTGMLIAKNGAITSEYINSRLDELKLEYHLIK